MIPINDPALYDASLGLLRAAVGANYLGRPAQILLAAKHYGKAMPQVGDPVGVQSGELERLLDDLYLKPSRAAPQKIAIIFEATHNVPSGTTGGVLSSPSNIWRNNFNFQKGYMCFGSTAEMLNPAFRNPSRLQCPHLQPAQPNRLAGATCALAQAPKPTYRGEDHIRMLRKDPASGEYWIYDPSDVVFYSSIFLPVNGGRLPIAPLIVALYFDSPLAAGRAQVDVSDFVADFGFTALEYTAYFDDDLTSQTHQAFLALKPGMSWSKPFAAQGAVLGQAQAQLPGLPPIPAPALPNPQVAPNTGANAGTTVSAAPPAGSQWWSAEQAVRAVLEGDGWQVLDFSRLGSGFDLKATKNGVVRLVEVKSALGPCSPTLTDREYAAAKKHRLSYVLAIVENFDPTKGVTVRWVQDPARLQVTMRTTTAYYLPRSIWRTPSTSNCP